MTSDTEWPLQSGAGSTGFGATVWIVGAKGFLGRHIARRFGADGYRVIGIGRSEWDADQYRPWGVGAWSAARIEPAALNSLFDQFGRPDLVVRGFFRYRRFNRSNPRLSLPTCPGHAVGFVIERCGLWHSRARPDPGDVSPRSGVALRQPQALRRRTVSSRCATLRPALRDHPIFLALRSGASQTDPLGYWPEIDRQSAGHSAVRIGRGNPRLRLCRRCSRVGFGLCSGSFLRTSRRQWRNWIGNPSSRLGERRCAGARTTHEGAVLGRHPTGRSRALLCRYSPSRCPRVSLSLAARKGPCRLGRLVCL